MCGIAGLMTAKGEPADRGTLERLGKAMAHRGPDGVGYHVQGRVGVVHCRLAIIDLVTGDQPLFGPDRSFVVANGEIYNHVELKAGPLAGETFRTGSDCEPPLFLYRRHGLDYPNQLRGMYAIALYDAVRDRLVLSRDPFGIKPLYYAECANGFVFASEPQAILATGWLDRRLRAAARDELLQLQFTTGAETIFEGVKRLLPGETIAVENGRIVERRLLPALPEALRSGVTEAEALYRLDAIFEQSVLFHQRADVPFGMFLSGGIDSSSVLAMMARLNDRPVQAFTAYFPETGAADERAQARAVARSLGAEHIEVEVGEDYFWNTLPAIAAHMDDPVADYAVVPTFRLAERARRSVKVILSGEGGDELFGGYGRYRSAMRSWPFRRAMRAKGAFDGLAVLKSPNEAWRAGYARAESDAKGNGRTLLQSAQALDCADWLPNDLLTKLDRCLMAHGVEGRVPFLDPEVARFAFALPDRLKVRGRMGKWLLRSWLAKTAPASQPFAPKQGFTVPVGEWILKRPDLGPLVARQPAIAEICEPDGVLRLFAARDKRSSFAAWTLLFYALWHRHHIEGVPRQGGVFETLNAKG